MPIIRNIKEPTLIRLVGFLLLPVGIILFSSNNTVGLIALIIGLGLLIANAVCTGIEINTDQKTYRKLYSFFGFVFGDWESLPKTEYLSVYKTRKKLQSPPSQGTILTTENYIIYSFFEDRRPVAIHKSTNKKDSFEVARHIASVLDVEILDSTEPKQKR